MEQERKTEKGSALYLTVTGVFFLFIFIVFIFFPRPAYSELEKRDLEEFPAFEDYRDNLSGYTSGISQWFSNTQPYRDHLLTMSMGVRDGLKAQFRNNEDVVSFHATEDNMETEEAPEAPKAETEEMAAADMDMAAENAKIANSGIVVVGKAPNARAMMAFGGSPSAVNSYINTVNHYAKEFPGKNVYTIISNSQGEFYMPPKVSNRNKPVGPVLEHIQENLDPSVNYVDVYSALKAHQNEYIYLRTDHHWSPLGAYYAAQAFAKKAGVPFKNLDSYDKNVVHGFVGSMYGYSKDISVKNSPEDFVYYTPKDLNYKTTFVKYKTDKNTQTTSESAPYESEFFIKMNDGNANAYGTFMGGDHFLVHVETGTPSDRKLLIIKDSFGNAVPGYLFYSFGDIHVVDFRYFTRNIKEYIEKNGITDIAFVFNIFNVCNSNTFKKVDNFLTQKNGSSSSTTQKEEKKDKKKA